LTIFIVEQHTIFLIPEINIFDWIFINQALITRGKQLDERSLKYNRLNLNQIVDKMEYNEIVFNCLLSVQTDSAV